MQKFNSSSIKKDVNNPTPAGETPAINVDVYIKSYPSNTASIVYNANNQSPGNAIPQPLQTDANGFIEFYAPNGRYNLEYILPSGVRVISDILINDPADSKAILSLTLAEAVAKTDAITDSTIVRITDRNNGLFAYKEGLTVTGHKVVQAVSPQVLNYVDSNKKASHLGFDSTPTFDNAQAFKDLLSLEDIEIDLFGVYESLQVIITVNNLNVKGNPGFELKSVDPTGTEQFISINTNSADASIKLGKFTLNANAKCAKSLSVTNTIKGKSFICDVDSENATQTSATGLAAGIYLNGGFSDVIFNNPVITEINSDGGSLIASGIRCEQNGGSVSDSIIVNNPVINGVRPGNDGDGVALLQDFPLTTNAVYQVNDAEFTNCHKRAIKTQCFKTIVRNPYIKRTEVHVQVGGNTDIDCQYGNGEIIDPTFDYETGSTAPNNGLISLLGERGAQVDNVGRGTHVIGGTCTVRDDTTRIDYLFVTQTFDVADRPNRVSVKGFKFNGKCRVIHNIRPLASATFEDDIVFNPSFEDSYFQDVLTSFFELDRSGTGFAFVDNANIINCTVDAAEIPLSTNVTTQVGITFDKTVRNTNIGDVGERFVFTHNLLTGATALSIKFGTPKLSSLFVSAAFASPSGNTHHTSRISQMQYGDGAGEDQEVNLSFTNASGGDITFSSALVGDVWELSVNKASGFGGTGSLDITVQSSQAITKL